MKKEFEKRRAQKGPVGLPHTEKPSSTTVDHKLLPANIVCNPKHPTLNTETKASTTSTYSRHSSDQNHEKSQKSSKAKLLLWTPVSGGTVWPHCKSHLEQETTPHTTTVKDAPSTNGLPIKVTILWTWRLKKTTERPKQDTKYSGIQLHLQHPSQQN